MRYCTEILKSGPNSGQQCGRVLVNCSCRYHGRKLPNISYGTVNNEFKQQIKQERKADTCSICLEEVAMYNFKKYEGIHIMNCGHKMHGKCYVKYLLKCENNSSCPLCRNKQLEVSSIRELRKLQTTIRQLNETLSNVQVTLREEEENSSFWMSRSSKYKKRFKELYGDYCVVRENYNQMLNMNNIHQTMIYNLQILNADLTRKVTTLTEELNYVEEESDR